MKGKRVDRVWGWDCHGLPAEVYTEEKLGIKDRRDIGTKVSLEKYINTCRRIWSRQGMNGKSQSIVLVDGLILKAPIRRWIKITWSLSGGPLVNYISSANI